MCPIRFPVARRFDGRREMRLPPVMGVLVRVMAGALLVLGLAISMERWPGFRTPHIVLGIVFALVLLVLGGGAIMSAKGTSWAWVLAGWSVLIVLFGLTHARFLPGSRHWIAQVIHVSVGLAGVVIADRVWSAPASHGVSHRVSHE
jgi:cytochrome c biogenesis protein CcdA